MKENSHLRRKSSPIGSFHLSVEIQFPKQSSIVLGSFSFLIIPFTPLRSYRIVVDRVILSFTGLASSDKFTRLTKQICPLPILMAGGYLKVKVLSYKSRVDITDSICIFESSTFSSVAIEVALTILPALSSIKSTIELKVVVVRVT